MLAELRALALLLSASLAGILLGYQIPGSLFVDFGPNDTGYARGFREDFEIDEPTLFRWTTNASRVDLPFHLRGPYDVTLRFKRHIEAPSEIRIFLSGEPVATFVVPQQDFTLRSFRSGSEAFRPFGLRVLSHSSDPRALGLALDWMEVRPARRFGALVPGFAPLAALLSWVLDPTVDASSAMWA